MLFIGSVFAAVPNAALFSTFAAAATADTVIAVILAARKLGVCNAAKPTENISKALKEDSITGIANGCGASASDAA
jgi:hypothetical protein